MTANKKIILSLLLVCLIVCTLFIWSNSLKNGEKSMAQSGQVTTALKPVLNAARVPVAARDRLVRKAAHFLEFFLLGVLWTLNLKLWKFPCPGAFGLLFSAVTAACDEGMQLLSDRSSRASDVLLDSSGAAAGILLLLASAAIVRRCRSGSRA